MSVMHDVVYYGDDIFSFHYNNHVHISCSSTPIFSYLWKYFDPVTSTHAHIMSILTLINAKFRENLIGIWEPFHAKKEVRGCFNFHFMV